MAINKTNRLAWIVKTIYKANKITFEELANKWDEDDNINGGKPLSKKSFHTWIWNILDTFGVNIECDKKGGNYQYYITNAGDLHDGGIDNWLLNTTAVSNSLMGCKSIKDKILLENIPSGTEYLDSVLEALKQDRFVHITYYNYWREETRDFYLMPLCVKLFRQRWYMVGRTWTTGKDILFCLDRFRGFRMSSHTFDYPKDFDPQEYFDGSFGIIADKKCKVEDVALKVSAGQANYLRDLPLMQGDDQIEVERNDEYSIFKLRVRPSFDFQQELLWNREELEVLEPLWLRKEIAGIVKRMWNKYNNE